MRILKGILTTLLTILFAFAIFLTFVLFVFKSFFSKDYVLKIIKSSDIYIEIQESANNIVEEYITEDNPNKEILEQFVDEENIEKIVDDLIDRLYESENFDSKEFQQFLNDNINEIAEEHDIEITKSQRDELDSFIIDVSEEFGIEDVENNTNIIKTNEEDINSIPSYIDMIRTNL